MGLTDLDVSAILSGMDKLDKVTVTSTHLRDNLGEVLDEVVRLKRKLLITRHGRPVALVVPVDRDGRPVEDLKRG